MEQIVTALAKPATPGAVEPDYAAAHAFLTFLDPEDANSFHFQSFTDKRELKDQLLQQKFDAEAKEASDLNAKV